MKGVSIVYSIVMLLLIMLLIPSIGQTDIYMKQKNHTDGFQMMGQSQPAKDVIQTVWITKDKIRSDDPEMSLILRLDKNKMYMLNHAQKTYTEMPMDISSTIDSKMQEAMDEEEMSEEERANAMSMMKGMTQMKVTITPTSEKKKIGNWNCQKYNQELVMMMGPMSSEIWATEDLKMDYDLYNTYMAAMMGKGGMFGDFMSQIVAEMKKVKGIPVLTTTTMNMMGASVKSAQELMEFKEGNAPAGYFDIPAGYKKTESGMQQY